jgi:hypothetical protein
LQAYSFRVKSSQAISHLEMELVSSIWETVYVSVIRGWYGEWCGHMYLYP